MSNQDRAEGALPVEYVIARLQSLWTLLNDTGDRFAACDTINAAIEALTTPQAPGADTPGGRGDLPRTFLRMTGTMVEADLEKNTITFEMEGDYVVAAGKYSIIEAAAIPTESSGGDAVADYSSEEILAKAPAEYTDWEKRIWRRGYVDAAIASGAEHGR